MNAENIERNELMVENSNLKEELKELKDQNTAPDRPKIEQVDNMVKKKEWSDFRNTGLLLIVNQILHIFGWALIYKIDDLEGLKTVYPARVKFRGFANDSITLAYKKISKFMKENAKELNKEANS